MIQLYQDNKLNIDTEEYIKESNIKNIIIVVGGEKSVSKEYRKRIKEFRKVRWEEFKLLNTNEIVEVIKGEGNSPCLLLCLVSLFNRFTVSII